MSCCESETLSVVSILGEPRDPRTWTHAPSSIMETIEKLGYPVVGFNSGIRNRYLNTILAKINQLAGPRQIESRRMRLARIICAIKVHRKTRCIKSKTVLHMGTLDLPVFKEDKSTKHYLYCDSTWNLLVKHYPRVGRHAIRASVTMDELERRCYSQMEHIFPASEYVREDLIKHYQIASEKVSVVGMGVGKIQPFMGQKDYRNGHILFAVKHGFEGKGGPLLIKGFEIAQKRNANLKLVVVGGEEYRERLNGVPNVTVTGYIPWNEPLNRRLCGCAGIF